MQFLHKRITNSQSLCYAWCEVLHARADIIMYGSTSSIQQEEVCKEVEQELQRIERMANRFNPNSEVSRVNTQAYPLGSTCSEELVRIVQECELFKERTAGTFDITIQSHTKGITERIEASLHPPLIRFLKKGVSIDLNGVIKGYALRKANEIIIQHGIKDVLINLGNSSILARGNSPAGTGWKVATADGTNEYTLLNECLTSSGNDSDSRRHIINPTTGIPIDITAITSVVSHDPMWGEALATSCFIESSR